MVDPIDDIVRQARQGSVSAIIQVLNEKLAGCGIRTRAMFEQGILQLLCEAAKPDQLEQPIVVPQVRQILQSLQPRKVRRVNINSRVVREQQLLWLEEIRRDPEKLLWSEEIILKQPNPVQRLVQDWKDTSPTVTRDLPKTSPKRLAHEKQVFWRGLLGGASFSIFLLLLGWALYTWLSPKLIRSEQTTLLDRSSPPPSQPEEPAADRPALQLDPFAEAVRLAEGTVTDGSSAQTSAEWLDVATRWQKASDLMSQIPPADPRYAVAQNRVDVYRQNSEAALQQVQQQ